MPEMTLLFLKPSIRRIVLITALAASSFNANAQLQTDYDEVAKEIAMTARTRGYTWAGQQIPSGPNFLASYIYHLDPEGLYFTLEDVVRLENEFGGTLHEKLFNGSSISAATTIYRLFETRVSQRIVKVQRWLNEMEFDFTGNEVVPRTRAGAPWPRDEQEADAIWQLQLKEAYLCEILRRESANAKSDAEIPSRQIRDQIIVRYRRFLSGVKGADEKDIASGFLNSVLKANDPHSEYISDQALVRMKSGLKNELVGVGVELQSEDDGSTRVIGVVVGGPADRSGKLMVGDKIVGIDPLNTGNPNDTIDILFMGINDVIDLIRGEAESSVALVVRPAGAVSGKLETRTIKREKVILKDQWASGQIIETDSSEGATRRLGVITLPSFYTDIEKGASSSSVDVRRILERMLKEKIDGLMLDLRGNGGGALDELLQIAGLFIQPGPVTQVKNHQGGVKVERSSATPIYGGPMAVLTDKRSASASEAFAGMLRDYHRAVLIGDSSTFGKGTIQQMINLGRSLAKDTGENRGGLLKLTTKKAYLPSGSSTQLLGVTPDIILPSDHPAEIGEVDLRNPLPHDRIPAAPDLKPLDPQALNLPILRRRSIERVNANKDFGYLLADRISADERRQKNQISLNLAQRRKDLADEKSLREIRETEQRVRFRDVSENDKKQFRFFKITLDNLADDSPLREGELVFQEAEFIRKADDADRKWPSGLDPIERESILILRDLVSLAKSPEAFASKPEQPTN